MSKEVRQYTQADLYGSSGRPRASDIDQDNIYNCYFLAPIGALGEQQPDRIREAIRFNGDSGDFMVRLYRPSTAEERGQGRSGPVEETVSVSQEDLRFNIERMAGGSTVDNHRDRSGAVWPAVLEAGFAELHGRDAQEQVNLELGYQVVGHRTRGGGPGDGLYALTGDAGERVRIAVPEDGPALVRTGPAHVDRGPPPFRAPSSPISTLSLDEAQGRVERALEAKQPVAMSTQGRDVHDGLRESHAYIVMGITRDAGSDSTMVRLRDPYGDNRDVNEGNRNSGNPEITVSLNRLVEKGSFGEFTIGPAPRTQTQTQGQTPDAPAQVQPQGSVDPSRTPVPATPETLTPSDRALNGTIKSSVQQLVQGMGKTWDDKDDRLTASLTLLAKRSGFSEMDQLAVMFNNPTESRRGGELVFLHRTGPDASNNPAANRAHMATADALAEPAQARYQQAVDTPTKAQAQAQQAPANPEVTQKEAQQMEPQPAVLKMQR